MSNFLAIDTSSRYLTVLAQKGDKRVLRHGRDCAMRHSVILMDEVQKALDEAELRPEECDFFAAVTGPGSFTGIRIGISAVKGFALGADKPVLGVTSFDLIAYNVNSENFYVVIDAAHSHYYVCGYGKGGEVVFPPCYMSEEDVRALEFPLFGFENLPFDNYVGLDAGQCLAAAVHRGKVIPAHSLRALYVRRSQAEENLNANKKVEI